MCRADVDQAAAQPLARILDDIAHALADQAGIDRAAVLIGPVDLGPAHEDVSPS